MDLVEGGLGRVESNFGFGLGIVGFGDHTREIFESQIDIDGARGTVEAGEL